MHIHVYSCGGHTIVCLAQTQIQTQTHGFETQNPNPNKVAHAHMELTRFYQCLTSVKGIKIIRKYV